MDALKDSDLLHWKHSLSELIDISIAQKTAIWRLYGRRSVFRQTVKAIGVWVLLETGGGWQISLVGCINQSSHIYLICPGPQCS